MMPARRFALCCAMLLLALGLAAPSVQAQTAKAGASTAKKPAAAKPLKLAPGKRAVRPRATARPAAHSRRTVAAPAAPSAVKPAVARPRVAASRRAHRTSHARGRAVPPVRAHAPIPPPVTVAAAEPMPLSPNQRDIIYRSIVQTPLQPVPVLTQRISPSTVNKPAQPARTPPPPAANAELTVGAQVPPTVALHPIPEPALAEVPEVEPYRYAFVGDRVFLVDPATGIVVAVINQ
jgi:hypothetical protein